MVLIAFLPKNKKLWMVHDSATQHINDLCLQLGFTVDTQDFGVLYKVADLSPGHFSGNKATDGT